MLGLLCKPDIIRDASCERARTSAGWASMPASLFLLRLIFFYSYILFGVLHFCTDSIIGLDF